jgi:two-component system, OmpR family, response regulator NblR
LREYAKVDGVAQRHLAGFNHRDVCLVTGSLILIAITELTLSGAMQADLEQSGYEVIFISKATDILSCVQDNQPDLVVLEEHLGKHSGLEVCKQLRLAGITVPLLVIMNGDRVEDRAACLLAGADDYFVTPYRRETFLQRVRLYLEPVHAEQGEHLKFDNLVLDLGTRTVLRGTQVISLTMKEYDLLKYLMEHPREVLTREQILENVWGYDFIGESNVIEVYIRYLRLKIEGEGKKKLIYTIRGVGYALRDS